MRLFFFSFFCALDGGAASEVRTRALPGPCCDQYLHKRRPDAWVMKIAGSVVRSADRSDGGDEPNCKRQGDDGSDERIIGELLDGIMLLRNYCCATRRVGIPTGHAGRHSGGRAGWTTRRRGIEGGVEGKCRALDQKHGRARWEAGSLVNESSFPTTTRVRDATRA